MRGSFEVTLCDEKASRVYVFVEARLFYGCLRVIGQDLGAVVQEWWDDDEYEYFYSFSKKETDRLFSLIQADGTSPEQALKEHFSGMDGCKKLREFCEANNIKYRFCSH